MHLYLSKRSFINSTLTDEHGQVLYKVDTPIWRLSRTTTLSCAIPDDIPRREGERDSKLTANRFAYAGKVTQRLASPSSIRFGGGEFEIKKYFRKEGWGPYGR
ncbi:hypothetical protein H0H87_000446, partial [Tephrocybe sp. NHM501043]